MQAERLARWRLCAHPTSHRMPVNIAVTPPRECPVTPMRSPSIALSNADPASALRASTSSITNETSAG